MTKTCPVCGKDFEVDSPAKKYCSQDCMKTAQRTQIREWKRRHPKPKKREAHVWKTLIKEARTAPCGWFETCFDCEEPDCTYKGQW